MIVLHLKGGHNFCRFLTVPNSNEKILFNSAECGDNEKKNPYFQGKCKSWCESKCTLRSKFVYIVNTFQIVFNFCRLTKIRYSNKKENFFCFKVNVNKAGNITRTNVSSTLEKLSLGRMRKTVVNPWMQDWLSSTM